MAPSAGAAGAVGAPALRSAGAAPGAAPGAAFSAPIVGAAALAAVVVGRRGSVGRSEETTKLQGLKLPFVYGQKIDVLGFFLSCCARC